ncbi:MAG: translation initiation factor IF-3 [Clostridia bacterium]
MWRCINIKDFLINEQIKLAQVQVIDDNGEKLGKMSTKDAIEIAYAKNLDLVLVSPSPENPVCKILDYSKYKFEMNKKAKEAKKHQKIVETKEVRLSPNIDKHDLEFKAKMAEKFILAGDKVKVAMRFRGRELNFINQGREIMNSFKDMISECQVEKEAKMEGKNLVLFIAPKQNK